MKITETKIPDINVKNIDQSKVNLAEKIIHNINPLFDDLYQVKQEEYKQRLITLKKIKNNF